MIYPHQTFEPAPEPSAESAVESLALLALKRFWKGTLRLLAIAAISLLLLLSLSAHSSAKPDVELVTNSGGLENALGSTLGSALDPAIPPLSEAFYGLKAEMTEPHLTSSRLAIPKESSISATR